MPEVLQLFHTPSCESPNSTKQASEAQLSATEFLIMSGILPSTACVLFFFYIQKKCMKKHTLQLIFQRNKEAQKD